MQLNKNQITQFDEQGFLRLENAVDGRLFEQLKSHVDTVQQWGLDALKRNELPPDFAYKLHFFLPYLNRVTQFHLYGGTQSLAMLGSPQVLEIAESLCGCEFLPTVDMLIVKNQHDDLDLPWHQDLIFDSSKYRVIALGIYLEDSPLGDGALKLVKNSQKAKQDIDALMNTDDIEVIEVAANAGDIVIHNPMLVHWSDRLQYQQKRRTLYYEFRPIAQVKEQENWPDSIIAQRLSLMAAAVTEHRRQHPENKQFSAQNSEVWREIDNVGQIDDFYQSRIPFVNANFSKALSARLSSGK